MVFSILFKTHSHPKDTPPKKNRQYSTEADYQCVATEECPSTNRFTAATRSRKTQDIFSSPSKFPSFPVRTFRWLTSQLV